MPDPEVPEATPEKPARTPKAEKAPKPDDDPGINANITGSVYDPAEKPKPDPDDPGINASITS